MVQHSSEASNHELDAVDSPSPISDSRSSKRCGKATWPTVLHALFGIFLPIAAIVGKNFCADVLFDPAPTGIHLGLLMLVPVHHLLFLTLGPAQRRRFRLDLLGGVTLGVCIVYSILFAPIFPIAVVALVAGIGILPLAPLAALIWGLVVQTRLWKSAALNGANAWYHRPGPATFVGSFLGIVLLIGGDIPTLVTEHGMKLASSGNRAEVAEGVQTLRRWGSQEQMLAACRAQGPGRALLLNGMWGHQSVSAAQARVAYYRTTGNSADNAPNEPRLYFGGERSSWDEHQGGSEIGGLNGKLELVGSRLDGSVNADAALGYAEWTMVFRNTDDTRQAEARARVELPKGGVVSRATLWIDGEPREAAFGGAGAVRAAYRSVVARRRDPLLVTAVGPDLVQIQCFPIEAGRGEMKILLGISFPLQLQSTTTATVMPPRIVARNFRVAAGLQHRAWLESKQPLSVDGREVRQSSSGAYVLEMPMPAALSGQWSSAVVARRSESAFSWTNDLRCAAGSNEPQSVAVPPDVGAATLVAGPGGSVSPDAGAATQAVGVGAAGVGAAAERSGEEDGYRSRVQPSGEVGAEKVASPCGIIEQSIDAIPVARPGRVAVVIDTSSSMAETFSSLVHVAPAMANLATSRVFLARESGAQEIKSVGVHQARALQVALRAESVEGGVDNFPALIEAARWVSDGEGGVLLWIHGPQPVLLDSPEELMQLFARAKLRLVHTQVVPGEHVALAAMGSPIGLETLLRTGTLAHDLGRQFEAWNGGSQRWVARRRQRSSDMLPDSPATSDHLARLWASEQIERLRESHRDAAVKLAVDYRLVSAVSGAVVLESQQQYQAAGLESPSEAVGAPSVPEPETWAMILLAAAFMLWQLGRRMPGRQFAS